MGGEAGYKRRAQLRRIDLGGFGSPSQEWFVDVRSWTMSFQLFGQARGIRKPSGRLLGWRRFSLGIGGRHAELAHIHGDGIEVRVPGTELGDDWEFPACGRSWMFVEEIPPASHLDIVGIQPSTYRRLQKDQAYW